MDFIFVFNVVDLVIVLDFDNLHYILTILDSIEVKTKNGSNFLMARCLVSTVV